MGVQEGNAQAKRGCDLIDLLVSGIQALFFVSGGHGTLAMHQIHCFTMQPQVTLSTKNVARFGFSANRTGRLMSCTMMLKEIKQLQQATCRGTGSGCFEIKPEEEIDDRRSRGSSR